MKRLCNRPGAQRFALGFAYTMLALITVPLTLLTLMGGINMVICRLSRMPSEQEIVRGVMQGAAEEARMESIDRARK